MVTAEYTLETHRSYKTAAWRLFHIAYEVSYPEVFFYSDEYLANNAIRSTGDRAMDQMRMLEFQYARRVGAGIAMLYGRGAPIRFTHDRDVALLYHDLREHLHDWLDYARHGYIRRVPLQDLRVMDDLASELYPRAIGVDPVRSRSGILDQLFTLNSAAGHQWASGFSPISASGELLKPYVPIIDSIEEALVP